ncbi:MAG: bifunctional 2-keto-4-hydroxyglutarate aldolase/2-keto-3-deoxy-6-phosphogluconate aldolase [Fusobacteriaceae bacterium]|nr:bifunctional 2-keto-4-hydroxyglutarate aldolase/2-keto-3-deoxy-6-phosphogluconate aldolase [Fusobacteriaceae bacterium]MBN2837520.1 bifunctional 2-keto-4-hydroxyglutarate aldolase/2-keto-3-deoxy-6-phosphogluconate aldolase [Fusobacteriaceae bacterium]
MVKFEILNKIKEVGVVAVIRESNPQEAIKVSKACVEGGIPAVEVTYTVPGASEVIKELKKTIDPSKLLVGAGSVLDSETARTAILAGATYIVSPAFDPETAKLCNRYQVPYMPGCMTITEMVTAMESGCDIIKLFPGSAFGPSFVKAVKAPLPQINIMPTGGVSLENVDEWIKNGVVAVGAGGQLTNGTYEEIVEKSREFVLKVEEARKKVK